MNKRILNPVLIACGLAVTLTTTLSCSPDSPKNYFKPFAPERKVTDTDASVVFDPKADILFVIDDSGSMDTHQRNLASNVSLFTSTFLQNSILDYNIGVVTTDADGGGWGGGGANCCGKLVGSTKIVTKRTPNSNSVLQNNMVVGTSGSGQEEPFSTTAAALSAPLLTSWNVGFARPEASLIVIFITDAEDQSVGLSPRTLLNQLIALKGNDPRKVLSYGAIIPSSERNCTRDDSTMTPTRIEEFLDIVPNGKGGGGLGDNTVSLCARDFGQRLAEFALQIVNQVSSVIYLSRLPDPNSLRVSYGASDLPMDIQRGWSYNPRLNAILLGPDINWGAQPPGSKVEVHYKEAREN